MDSRILLVVIALLVVYWLVRSRFILHSQSGSESKSSSHPHRRFSDRTLTGKWLQAKVDRETQAPESMPSADSMNRVTTDTAVVSPPLSGASGSLQPAPTPVADKASQSNSEGMQSEVDRLTELLQQRDRILARNRHAMEEVEKLKKKLFDKGREMEMLQQACARSDAALAHYRTRAQRSAMLEQQLAEAREQIDSKERELNSLRIVSTPPVAGQPLPVNSPHSRNSASSVTDVTRRKNQISKKQLARELRGVEKQAENARQNSLELRRIRSELESVCEDRANARTRIAELQVRVQAQQQAMQNADSSPESSDEVTVLKQTLLDRQHQNEELRQQLSRLSVASADETPSSAQGRAPDDQDTSLGDEDR